MRYKVTVYTRNEDTKRYVKDAELSSPVLSVIDDELACELIRILIEHPYAYGRIDSKGVSFTFYPDEIHKEFHVFKK